jgi:hypothetical protein
LTEIDKVTGANRDTGVMEMDWATGADREKGLTEMDRPTGSIYSGDSGVDEISSYII